MSKPIISIVNGSLGNSQGNTGKILDLLKPHLRGQASLQEFHLAEETHLRHPRNGWIKKLRKSDGFVFASGTYWDSWGSPMQAFLEQATEFEASDLWLGKPAATLITMHSVGGKEVLSRLQGVLNTFGLLIPPMSGMAYSLANHLALQTPDQGFHSDFWSIRDLEVIAHNLLQALSPKPSWRPWAVDGGDPYRSWMA